MKFVVGWIVAVLASAPSPHAQVAPSGSASRDVVPPRLQEMVGTWDVKQRMWTAAGTSAIDLPPAIARRRVIDGAFLKEIRTLAPGMQAEPFTRVSYVTYTSTDGWHAGSWQNFRDLWHFCPGVVNRTLTL